MHLSCFNRYNNILLPPSGQRKSDQHIKVGECIWWKAILLFHVSK